MKQLFLCWIVVSIIFVGIGTCFGETVVLTPNTNWYVACEDNPLLGCVVNPVVEVSYQGLIGYYNIWIYDWFIASKVTFPMAPAPAGTIESAHLILDSTNTGYHSFGPIRIKQFSTASCVPVCNASCSFCTGTLYLSDTITAGSNISFNLINAIPDIQNALDTNATCFGLCLQWDFATENYQFALNNIRLELVIAIDPPNPDNCDADSPICMGELSELTADDPGDGFELYWFDHDTTPVGTPAGHIGTGTSVMVAPETTTTYFAWTYDDAAEEWSDESCSVEVIVLPLPAATASSNSTAGNPVPEGGELILTGGPNGMVSYLWEAPNGTTHNEQNWTIDPANHGDHQGTYTLTVFNGDCEGIATVYAWVGDPPPIPATGPLGIGLLLLTLGGLLGITRKRRRKEE